MGASRWFFSISGVILLVGALALATKQLNFGIDFESGTRINVALAKPTDEEGVREPLDDAGVSSGEEVQQVTDPDFGDNVFQIQSHELAPDEVRDAERQLSKDYGFGSATDRLRKHQRRPDLRPAGRQQRPARR